MSDILTALENERRYVARELHDGVAQTALQLGLQATICAKLLERGNLELLTRELAELEQRIQLASTQMRELIADMRPPRLEPEATLNDDIRQALDLHQERGGPPVVYDSRLSGQLPVFSVQQRLTLFRIIEEALLNVRKHAEAEEVRLSLSDDLHNFYLTVSDNGQGFDPAEVAARSADKGGAGLANLRARAEALGGTLSIATGPSGQGTEIKLTLPR